MSHAAYLDVQVGNRDELVTRHAPLVKRIAYHLLSRLPASVEVDDLIQAGMIGLLEAASNFRAGQGAGFETYASIRIRGAMIDQMRQGAWAPRSVSRQLRELAAAVNRVESRLGREAQAAEIAEEMGIDINDYYDLLSDTAAVRLVSLEQASDSGMEFSDEDDSADTPLRELEDEGLQRALATQIEALPEREKLVMALYYDQGLNLKEIGEVLEVSESRVCQIHSQAVLRLKGRLGDWLAA
ncbi:MULTISPECIES: RNA polymerase sigma factor FliA [Spongiibacter]|uniref:RNA polymerase sigma factor FliA n=1 Tax=Spongiibacter TaxID=630749 RepID=UPI0003B4B635|nr:MULTISPECIES: RNA polymerase sigma factor FliA [Spongiibacter]MAY39666.1 RNA polymerase sigma factor FliA [Spongiibacter sp.]MBO6753440.1 RNA polymerase sigma factor FliA [Spongiibacter sp.]